MISRRGRSLLTSLLSATLVAIPLVASAIDYTVSSPVGGGVGTCTTTPKSATSVAAPDVWGLASDSNGNIWYTDRTNFVICKLTPDGNVVRVAGTGVRGIGADNVQATSSELYDPISLAVDANGVLYIGEYSGSRAIRKVGTDGVITTILNVAHGSTSNGIGGLATAAGSTGPTGIAISPSGDVYYSEYGASRVKMIDSNGYLQLVAGNGNSGNTGDGGLATAATLSQIACITFDKSGNLYISSYTHNVRKVDTAGIITKYAGTYGTNSNTGNGGLATAATFRYLWGIVTDGVGNLYIPERGGTSVRKVDAATGIVTAIAGVDGGSAFADGSTSVARFGNTYAVAFTPNGDLYVSDLTNARIRKIASVGEMSVAVAPDITFTALNKYRLTSTINASGGASGKITFYANGKRIPRCISIAYTGNYSCSWKPSGRGAISVYASVLTSSNAVLKSSPITVGIASRTTLR